MEKESRGVAAEALLELFAARVAELVVEKLQAATMHGWVDQASSPLGRRRHINAVRSGTLPGLRLGRRYLAREEDVTRLVARETPKRAARRVSEQDLAAELGLRSAG